MDRILKIYCDGGARGNPGPAAAAFVVIENGKVVFSQSKYLGKTTNNVAEYEAVVLALGWLVKQRILKSKIQFILDSELITKQMKGVYKVKSQNLKPIFIKAKRLESRLPVKIIYKWATRENNKLADFLVNKELDKNC
jgi:ribonuclease HI